jgi:TldD protein
MPGVKYYDLRHVTGQVTHIDIDNGVVESAGTSFFNKAVLRVLDRTGWGVIQIDNYTPCTGRKFEELIESAQKLAGITGEIVELSDVPHGILPVPPMKEDPRSVSIEEKSSLLAGIEEAARHPLVTNRRANYVERIEQVQFEDSSANVYSYEICRSGFNIMAVAPGTGMSRWGMSGNTPSAGSTSVTGRNPVKRLLKSRLPCSMPVR